MPLPYTLAFEAYKGQNRPYFPEREEEEEVLIRGENALITGGGLPTLLVPGSMSDFSGKGMAEISPIEYIQEWFKKRMVEYSNFSPEYKDKILIVRAKTGSGKSSLMPVYLYRMLKKGTNGGVICVQPRVLTAQQLAIEQGSGVHYRDMKYKENVGYITGNGKMRPKERNSLIYMTSGVFLQIMRTSTDAEIMKQFRFIVLDEVHERSLMLDMGLLQVKSFLKRNCDNERCPLLILTSATFDTEKYAKYMEVPLSNIVNVEGQTFPIETIWPKNDADNFLNGIVDTVSTIVKNKDNEPEGKDILIFAPGDEEIRNITQGLSRIVSSVSPPFIILSVSGKKVKDDHIHRRLIFEPYDNLKVNTKGEYDPKSTTVADRRVIVATTVAETGLTIETLGYVIDYGMDRHVEMFAPYGISGLITAPAAQSKILQRKGRTGRLFPGKFYPIYTEETFLSLPVQSLPSIITEDLDRYLLYMMSLITVDELASLDMLDNPPVDSLKQTFETLYYQGYVGLQPKFHITKLGEIIAKSTSLSLSHFRLLASSYLNEISIAEMMTYIACSMEMPRRMLDRNFNQKRIAEYMGFEHMEWKLLTMDTVLDLLVVSYMCFQIMEENLPSKAMVLVEEMGVKWGNMIGIIDKRLEMMNDLGRCGLEPFAFHGINLLACRGNAGLLLSHVKKIKRSVVDAYGHRVLEYKPESDSYQTIHGVKVGLPFHYPGLDYLSYNPAKEKFNVSRKPRYVISPNIILENTDREKNKYSVSSAHAIVLDGYVPFDPGMLRPEGHEGESPAASASGGQEEEEDIEDYNAILQGYNALLGQMHMLQHSVIRKGSAGAGILGVLLELHS